MSRQFRPISLAFLIACLPSCYQWQEQGPTPKAALENRRQSPVYITRKGGSITELRHVVIVGDSVVGEVVARRAGVARPRVAIPLSEVVGVRTRKLNGGKTAGLVGGVVAGALLVPVIIFLATYEDQS
jgi:hypothetical protein